MPLLYRQHAPVSSVMCVPGRAGPGLCQLWPGWGGGRPEHQASVIQWPDWHELRDWLAARTSSYATSQQWSLVSDKCERVINIWVIYSFISKWNSFIGDTDSERRTVQVKHATKCGVHVELDSTSHSNSVCTNNIQHPCWCWRLMSSGWFELWRLTLILDTDSRVQRSWYCII